MNTTTIKTVDVIIDDASAHVTNSQASPENEINETNASNDINTSTEVIDTDMKAQKINNAPQQTRKDILEIMLQNVHLKGKNLFNLLINENENISNTIKTKNGWVYETICQLVILLKCIDNLHYTEIYYGQLQCLKLIKNINNLLQTQVNGGGNNIADMVIKQGDMTTIFSVKYNDEYKETDVSKIDNTMSNTQNIITNYNIGLFCKNKELYETHKFKNKQNIDKLLIDKIILNNLLFDKLDIIKALDVFCERFTYNSLTINEFVDFINKDYLLSPRQQLTKKLHQQMTQLKIMRSINTNKNKQWCISHKPRSGKSITMLSISKQLLEEEVCKKILIMTAVPATINSFVDDLDKYIDFKDIQYKLQYDMKLLDSSFNGIMFCSTEYLKTNTVKKKDYLKKINFDAIIMDECHLGGSTDKTKTEILDVSNSIEDVRKNIKLNIFASGTADKTIKHYGIQSLYVNEWDIEDEAFMKELMNPDVNEETKIVANDYMIKRHGLEFTECLHNETLNKDYSKHPTQVLMKHSISKNLIKQITLYNNKNGTTFGYSYSSLFALRKAKKDKPETKNGKIVKNVNGEDFYDYEYIEEFEIERTNDGIDILIDALDVIISDNMMRDTIMKNIEKTQTIYKSRKSTLLNPLLFIIYLPIHTGNNNISMLQKTLVKFLKTNKLWEKYNVEYSNSIEDTGDISEEYNEYIKSIMNKTKADKKRGCILLLGNKGSVGITYHDCDVTISLDDGHNIDNQKQRFSRALTESTGKTIGINVDMNIQRTYMYLHGIIQKHRKNTTTTKSDAEILYYLFTHNIFLFDPQNVNNGDIQTLEIMSYYQKEVDSIMSEIDDTQLLEQIVCNDDMRKFIVTDFQKQQEHKKLNCQMAGDQQDCPKGDTMKTQIDGPCIDNEDTQKKDEVKKLEQYINQTLEMCKSFLFPLLALISRSYKIHDFKEIFTSEKTGRLIISLLQDKKIELNKDNITIIVDIMNQIIDNNADIINVIREIYRNTPAPKLKLLIEKHFVPTNDEKKQNAEVPTPVVLVNDMLDKIPEEFWKTPKKVFEPCCGKGNFVLGIFDKFYNGLKDTYDDEIECCKVIMTECIYYADLTAFNVFVTTEILKCHVQSYCALEELDYTFNSYTGDTLTMNLKDVWNISLEDVSIIGNPPYSTNPSKPDTKPLYDKFIEKYIGGKLLLFVVPSRWFIGGKGLDSFRDFMMKRKDIVFIQHEDDATKWFGNNNVDIKGGVNYFLKDTSYNGLCLFNDVPYELSKYDVIINPKYHKIINSVSNMESIVKTYCSSGYFKYRTNDSRLKNNGNIKCFVSTLKSKDRCKYIDNYDFNKTNTFWKVITTRAAFKAFSGFGAKFIGKPNEIYTDSYISFRVKDEDEAKSLLSYLDTKFANHMLSVRKISQDISENTCKWIPLVPLDRIWSDDNVCEYLKIEQTIYA